MNRQIVAFLALLVVTYSMFESPKVLLSRGIDISDGVYEDFTGYNVEIDTSCKDVSLNRQGTPYNYNGTVLSGYLKVNKGNSALSFMFYGKENVARDQVKDVPTVIWLNGGPGSTSQLGNLMEIGPFRISTSTTSAFNITRNPWAWTSVYNILFVDQPVGTGLSYADPNYPKAYVTNMTEVANDFYIALNQLYNNQNGCFQKVGIRGDSPLFIFGESYGGKYAPAISEKILRQAKDNKGFLTGLKGVAIGDGFTSPFSTISFFGEYAYNLGLIDYQDRTRAEQYLLNASYQFINQRMKDLHDSFYKILDTITNSSWDVNVYDVTRYDQYPTTLMDSYFASDDVVKMYQLDPSVKFNSQYSNVKEGLYEDFMRSQVALVEKILMNYDVQLLVYTGQNDLICNTPGTFKWVEGLHQVDADKFRDTFMTPYTINGDIKGFFKKVGKLELRTINNAGHMIPMDQPEVALSMVTNFVKGATSSPVHPTPHPTPKQNIVISN